jgi:preprotein translocase subunit YajC
MFKFLTKQFLYGQIFLWLKPRLSGLFLVIILIISVFYFHSEYLKFVEFSLKNQHSYLGLSFIIKNSLIVLIILGYFYFYRTLNKTKDSIKQTQELIKKDIVLDGSQKVKSLDDFLSDDEINRNK